MTQEEAVKIASEAIKAQIKTLAVEANLYELYKMDNAGSRSASEKRTKMREALKVLKNFQGKLFKEM